MTLFTHFHFRIFAVGLKRPITTKAVTKMNAHKSLQTDLVGRCVCNTLQIHFAVEYKHNQTIEAFAATTFYSSQCNRHALNRNVSFSLYCSSQMAQCDF